MSLSASEIIDTAVRIEKNGETFYREAAAALSAGAVKDLFLFLADEDVRHARIFAGLSQEVATLGDDLPQAREEYPGEYEAYLKAFADGHVFTRLDTGSQVARKMSSPAEALAFAEQIEMDSVLFYTEMKRFIAQSQWSILDRIIAEERGHYMKLTRMRQAAVADA